MNERSFRGLLWTLAVIGLVLDLSTKYVVFDWLHNGGEGGAHSVVGGVFEILADYRRDGEPMTPPSPILPVAEDGRQRVNQGALFGKGVLYYFTGDERPGPADNLLFAVISLVAACAIAYWSTHQSVTQDWALSAALGLILAGTIGNLYDRVVFGGVRDFIHWHYYDKFDWPVFNIADCCLVIGAILLLAQAFFSRSAPETTLPSATEAVTPPLSERVSA